ncbi:FKBP-type peptidyl-prolyl cis-trans isomerase [Halomonas garicola]|uniref:FKBP-type peptidyl-prolyl cis-trans isomerase n=1 Tax=Halomonas garicola TaxID=1690008 RepID=UPI00289AB61F|nr:peptidylprolyl isomerase [Halomonas garicola]
MSIAAHLVVTLHYVLTDVLKDPRVLDDSAARNQPLEYLHGHDNIVPGLERALAGHRAGDETSVTLSPAEAYGERDEALVREVGREAFGAAEPTPGSRFQTEGEAGPQVVTVLAVDGNKVTVDTNHPLAGRTLRYDVRIVGVRDATRAELAKGHPLAPDVDASSVEDSKVL